MGNIAMQVDLAALEEVGDIELVIDVMGLDKDNELVEAIMRGVKEFQSQKALRAYLKRVNATTIFLNLQID